MTSALAFERIEKSFGGVAALRGVSVEVAEGEVHALVGENGAGKSTLMRIAAGILRPDAGRLHKRGAPVELSGPRDALDRGIGLVHQETLLFPNLDVAENIFAGREIVRAGRVRRSAMRRRTADLLADLHLPIRPETPVSRLSAAHQQLLQVARALAFDCDVLILDEPTTSLTDSEVQHLFAVLGRLRARGVTIIYVSHRLPEVFALCERVTVLRDGALIGTWRVSEVAPSDVVRAMVGRDLDLTRHPRDHRAGGVVLEVENLSRPPHFEHVSLRVEAGEIVGLFGLVGSGRTELVETIFGLHRPKGGVMRISGQPYAPGSPVDAVRQGVVLTPEMRHAQGLFFNLSVADNIVLAREEASGRWRRRRREERNDAKDVLKQWSIRAAGPDVPPDSLSGGNQQKVVLARWLLTRPRLLLLDEPTKGVDVGAKHEIHSLVRREADRGMACLVVSSELPELIALADRIVVLKEGHVQGEMRGDITEEAVMRLATRTDAAPAEVFAQ
jgi:rhamnose transport system ATP-binding protein